MKRNLALLLLLLYALGSHARLLPDREELGDRLFMQGAISEMRGDHMRALAAYGRLIRLPDCTDAAAEACFELAIELQDRALRDEAALKLRELDPVNERVDAWMNALAIEEGNALLDSVLVLQHDSLHVVLRLARHADKGEDEAFRTGAGEVLAFSSEKAVRRGVNPESFWGLLAGWARLKSDPGVVEGWLEDSRLANSSAEGQRLLAVLRLQLELREPAMQAIEKGIGLDSTLTELHRLRGLLLYDEGRLEEAEAALTTALSQDPENPDVLLPLAGVVEQRGHLADAEYLLGQFLRLYPGVEDSWLELIAFQERRGAPQRALELYGRAYHVFADQASPLLKNNYAYSLSLQEQNLDLALRLAREAVSEAADNAAYRDTLGWIYFLQGRYADAESELVQAYDLYLGRQDAELLSHLGELRFAQGNLDEAIALWSRSLELDPDNETLRLRLNRHQADHQLQTPREEVSP